MRKRHSLNAAVFHHRMVDNHLSHRDTYEDAEVEPQKRSSMSSEEWLWFGVMESAVAILRRGPMVQDDGEYSETREWVRSDEDYIGSFTYVCNVLGVNSEYLREGLLRIEPNGRVTVKQRPSGTGAIARPAASHLRPQRSRRVAFNREQAA